jgi:hypothetical protein
MAKNNEQKILIALGLAALVFFVLRQLRAAKKSAHDEELNQHLPTTDGASFGVGAQPPPAALIADSQATVGSGIPFGPAPPPDVDPYTPGGAPNLSVDGPLLPDGSLYT